MLKRPSKTSFTTRLIISFLSIFIMFLIVISYVTISFGQVDNLYRYQIYFIGARTEQLLELHQTYTSTRNILSSSFFNQMWLEQATDEQIYLRQGELLSHYESIVEFAYAYITSVEADPFFNTEDIEVRIEVMSLIASHVDTIHYMLSQNAAYNLYDILYYADSIENLIHFLRNLASEASENTQNIVNNAVESTHNTVIAMSLFILFGTVLIAYLMVKSFMQGIKLYKNRVSQIIEGNIEVYDDKNDEISSMINDITKSFMFFTENINDITKEKENNNNARMDITKLNGVQKEVAIAINNMLNKIYLTKEDNDMMQVMFDNLPVVITVWDKKLNMVTCNKEALNRYKLYDISEYKDNFMQLQPERQPDGSLSVEKAKKLIAKGFEDGYLQFEWIHKNKHDERIPSDIICLKSTYKGEDILISYSFDLRTLKASMKKEKETTDRMHLMFDNAPILIQYWDEEYKLIETNEMCKRMFKLEDTKSEYLENWQKILPRNQPNGYPSYDIWKENLGLVFLKGSSYFEFVCIDSKDEEVYLEVIALKTTFNNKPVVITYATDITNLKIYKEEALEAEHRSEALLESSQAKSKFLAKMSHEIRTPLSAVMGISEIQLQNGKHTLEVEEAFFKIHQSTNMLLGIVNDILDLSKIEAGKMDMVQNRYEVASLISDVAQLHMIYLESKRLELKIKVKDSIPSYLIGDELRIKQVLNNLLSNALKYTQVGHIMVSFKAQPIDIDNINFVISILDTGVGMSKKQLSELFDEYSRFHEENSFIQGTGLGMSITRNLIGLMQGDLHIESEVGVGTVATIIIPQKIADHTSIGKETVKNLENFKISSMNLLKKSNFKPEPMPYGSVLVVDDTDTNIYVANGLLSFYKLNIDNCHSGIEAIEKIKQGNVYDIIFMDHMMPEMDGVETTRIIRKLGYNEPIVAFTANALVGQAEEFIRNGFDGFISKPIQTVHLNGILNKFVRDKHAVSVVENLEDNLENSLSDDELLADLGINLSEFDDFDELDDYEVNEDSTLDYLKDPEIVAYVHKEFLTTQDNAKNEILEALANNDITTAHRIVHTIKGLAALIFEEELRSIAEKIEKGLLKDILPTEDEFAIFFSLLDKLFDKIKE